jgi:hypothetical protein
MKEVFLAKLSQFSVCNTALDAIKEMQIKTTLRFHLTPVRIAIISNNTNNRCW